LSQKEHSKDTSVRSWTPSSRYKKVAEVNRQFYKQFADLYDKTETCVVSPRLQKMMEQDLEKILQMISKKEQIHVLDACGGSGNAALKLLNRGAYVTLCDISPELIQIFERKCKEKALARYETVCSEIGTYLSQLNKKFDIIVFSSALHHILDYTSVLKIAVLKLNEGGVIYTVFDPVRWKFPTYQIIYFDWLLHAILNYPFELLSTIRRRLFSTSNEPDYGTLCEYHVKTGIDDYELVQAMKETGITVVSHIRYSDARHLFFRLLLRRIKGTTSFKLILRK